MAETLDINLLLNFFTAIRIYFDLFRYILDFVLYLIQYIMLLLIQVCVKKIHVLSSTVCVYIYIIAVVFSTVEICTTNSVIAYSGITFDIQICRSMTRAHNAK